MGANTAGNLIPGITNQLWLALVTTQAQPVGDLPMKMFLLMVLFSTPEELKPHQLAGFGPREAISMDQCLSRRSTLETYIEKNKAAGTKFKVFCVELEAKGFDDALASFESEIGDPA